VNKVLLAVDGTPEVVQEAVDLGAELIMAHHPLMFKPLRNLRDDNLHAQIPLKLIRHDIGYYAAHTNLDQSPLAASKRFAQILGLEKCEILAETGAERLVKIAVYIPRDAVEDVRQALAKVGVGEGVAQGERSGNYAECFFQCGGQGMFRPLAGAEPAIGEIGELTRVDEVKLESVMPERLTAKAVKALLKAHPYEEPAFDLIPLNNQGKTRGYGVIGKLPAPEPLKQVWQRFIDALSQNRGIDGPVFGHDYALHSVRLAGDPDQRVQKIAIVNGSGGSFVPKALAKGADLFIAGDVDHHAVMDALQGGMAVGELGHFLSEAPMLVSLANYLRASKALADIEFLISKANRVPWI